MKCQKCSFVQSIVQLSYSFYFPDRAVHLCGSSALNANTDAQNRRILWDLLSTRYGRTAICDRTADRRVPTAVCRKARSYIAAIVGTCGYRVKVRPSYSTIGPLRLSQSKSPVSSDSWIRWRNSANVSRSTKCDAPTGTEGAAPGASGQHGAGAPRGAGDCCGLSATGRSPRPSSGSRAGVAIKHLCSIRPCGITHDNGRRRKGVD